MSNLYWGLLPSVLGYLSMVGQSFLIDSMYNLSRRNLLVAMFAHESLFIAFTYLYRSTQDLSAIVLLGVMWSVVVGFRILERRRAGPKSDDET